MHPQGTQGTEEAFILNCFGGPSAIERSQVHCSKAWDPQEALCEG